LKALKSASTTLVHGRRRSHNVVLTDNLCIAPMIKDRPKYLRADLAYGKLPELPYVVDWSSIPELIRASTLLPAGMHGGHLGALVGPLVLLGSI
jgi:hypothetical protein